MALGTPSVPVNGAGNSTTPSSPHSTGSITLTANTPGLIFVTVSRNPATTIAVGTTGLTVGTITAIGSITYGTIASPTRRISAFWYPGSASPGTGTFDFSFGGAPNGIAYGIVEWPGMDTTAPIINPAGTHTNRADTSTSPLVTLDDGAIEATIGAFANGDSTLALTLGTGFGVLVANQTVAASNSFRMRVEYLVGKDLTVDMSQTAAHWGGVAFGIKAAPADASTNALSAAQRSALSRRRRR